jgi:hypothetical protein
MRCNRGWLLHKQMCSAAREEAKQSKTENGVSKEVAKVGHGLRQIVLCVKTL